VQRAFPEAKVVKTLNTLNASVMAHPEALPEPTSVFVSGDDADAKATVTAMLHEFGHTDVIDLGDITTARGTEWMMPFWLRLMQALGTPAFNYRIVRNS
jgi:predicted dinucleotide-binding enzyme